MLLIISRNKRNASALSDTFHYMSLLSFPATPKEALSEISIAYKAVIIIDPESFPDIKDYVDKIKSYNKSIPLFAISDSDLKEQADLFASIFEKNDASPQIASQIINYCEECGVAKIGSYKLAGFNASCDQVGVSYFYFKPNLTKTESMILRYLICTYPIPQSAEKILRHAFRQSRTPEAACIRTHISTINKKLVKISGRKHIELSPGQGYYINTPELVQSKKIM